MKQLEFRSVNRLFPPDVAAVSDLSFSIERGTWSILKGPSGSGKSTILHLAAGIDIPTSGDVFVAGSEISELSSDDRATLRRLKMGFVFQQFFLVPYLNALENLLLAQHFHSTTDANQAKDTLARVGLGNRMKHTPSQLSGGEKQRLCIARSIINSPELLIADEPTASLDETNQKQILQLFSELHRSGLTIFMASHDPLVDDYADEVRHLRFGKFFSV